MEEGEEVEKSIEALAMSYRMKEIGLKSIVRDGNAVSYEWE